MLNEVIEAEREIQKRLEDEKLKAGEWIEGVKRGAGIEVIREEGRLEESLDSALKNARAEAERKVAEIIAHAGANAERLSKISEDESKGIIKKHLIRILPHDS